MDFVSVFTAIVFSTDGYTSPFFTFFMGGVAAFEGGVRVGAIGVSGLPGDEDDRIARESIARAGLDLE